MELSLLRERFDDWLVGACVSLIEVMKSMDGECAMTATTAPEVLGRTKPRILHLSTSDLLLVAYN